MTNDAPDPFADGLPVLDGARLRLRPPRPNDEPALFAVFSDPEGMRYWSHEPFTHPDAARDYRATMERGVRTRTLYQWGIAERDGDGLIGTVTLYHWDATHRRVELGYMLARTHWGRGFAAEAVSLALRFAFGPMGVHRVEADTDPRNEGSVRLLERLGFQSEGRMRERWFTYGEFSDSLFFGLLRTDAAAVPFLS